MRRSTVVGVAALVVNACLLVHRGVDAADAYPAVLPGDVSWLGDVSGGDGTVDDFNQILPLGYVLMGPGTLAVVRILLPISTACPMLQRVLNSSATATNDTNSTATSNGDFEVPTVQLRAVGDWSLPHPFPIRVCDVRLETLEQRGAYNRNEFTLGGVKRESLPSLIPEDPARFLFLSDTGLRSRPYNLGIVCNSTLIQPTLYGVPQCPVNVTQSQLSAQEVRVDAQAIDDWPLPSFIKKAVRQEPDVVVFAGGALYRQGPCPATSGAQCVGINGGGYHYFGNRTRQAIKDPSATIVNFLPGRWGDNWFGWWADFIFPTKALLTQAPWIVARGSDLESSCDAGGRGYWLLLSTEPYPNGTRAGDFCPESNGTDDPYAVTFTQEQILVMNSGMTNSFEDSEFVTTSGECPFVPTDQLSEAIVVPNGTSFSDLQLSQAQESLKLIQKLSAESETNFLVSHRSLFGVFCSQAQLFTSNGGMHAALGGNVSLLDSISGVFSGHHKVLQVMEFVNNTLPFQVILGNGGTKVDDLVVDPDLLSSVVLQVGEMSVPVARTLSTNAQHGFALMERNSEGSYDLSFYGLDPVARAATVLDHQLVIPKGSRFPAPSGSPTLDSSPAPAPQPGGDSIVSPSVPTSEASSSLSSYNSYFVPLLLLGGVGAAINAVA
jgi:hypothetical protein